LVENRLWIQKNEGLWLKSIQTVLINSDRGVKLYYSLIVLFICYKIYGFSLNIRVNSTDNDEGYYHRPHTQEMISMILIVPITLDVIVY